MTFRDHVSETELPPLFLAQDTTNQRHFDYSSYIHLQCNLAKPETTPYSNLTISSHSAIYSGPAFHARSEKQLNETVLRLGDTTIDIILDHKTLSHDCFMKANLPHLRPNTFKILRRGADPLLTAKAIREQMPHVKQFIIKSPELSSGDGVIVVREDELDIILNTLLNPDMTFNPENESHMVTALYFALNSKNPKEHLERLQMLLLVRPTWFLVEEYIVNKPIAFNNRKYDATMRFVFAFTRDKMTERKIIPLAYYWKLPPQAFDSDAELRERCISSYTKEHHLSVEVSDADAAMVFAQLKDTLPELFSCMLQQDILAMAKEDLEANEHSHLWRDVSLSATNHGYFAVAMHAFQQQDNRKNGDAFAKSYYYKNLATYHYLQGDYVSAIKIVQSQLTLKIKLVYTAS